MALLYVNITFLAGQPAGVHRPCCQMRGTEIHGHYMSQNAVLTSKASYRSTSSVARFPLPPCFSDSTEAFSAYWQPGGQKCETLPYYLASELNGRPHSAISGGSVALPAGPLHGNSEAASWFGGCINQGM